jgi:hypothetical protein
MYSPELGIDYYQYVIGHSTLSTPLLSFKAIIGPSIFPHMIFKAIIRHCRLLLSFLLAKILAILAPNSDHPTTMVCSTRFQAKS